VEILAFKEFCSMPMPALSREDIKMMEKVCKLAARTLEYVGPFVKAGITTDELDKIVYDYTLTHNAKPAPLGYHGYPKSICTSVNQVICHGVPNSTVLKNGDIINVDVTTLLDGYFGDCSGTFFVGNVSAEAREITEVAREARDKGIEAITPNGFTGDIGFVVDKYVTRKGYHTVKEIGGHGIGKTFHGDPFVPSFGKKGKGEILLPWRCLTVEPMVNQTSDEIVEFDIKGSTVKYYETHDKSLSAQFEHTILVTDIGYEILTVP
jgi:methionyl aminopeptidase